ncbi:hypothetical protein ABZ079_01225 [Streptomyces sp. NPDC006314]|uniref:hypothetical protein n=1 Tax=Streptomyces sp. NPDC006314 TaxID=3154475 RepID=UPI0033B09B76
MDVSFLGGPRPQRGAGVGAPFGFVLGRDLWRWVPDEVSLPRARTPFVPAGVSPDPARLVSEHESALPSVEAEPGMRVLSANQVTMWAALRRLGTRVMGPCQALLDMAARERPVPPEETQEGRT